MGQGPCYPLWMTGAGYLAEKAAQGETKWGFCGRTGNGCRRAWHGWPPLVFEGGKGILHRVGGVDICTGATSGEGVVGVICPCGYGRLEIDGDRSVLPQRRYQLFGFRGGQNDARWPR